MIRIIILILILSLSSCIKEEEQKTDVNKDPVAKSNAVESKDIDVPLLDAQGLQSLLDEHKGQILFINTWATWCVPCKEEFPDLVRLQDFYRNSDVVIVGISVDFPDQIENAVKPFLISQNANFPNYVQNFKDPADLINLINKDWRGAVPATFIYDKNGNQQAFLLGKHSFEEFKSKIENIRKLQ